MIKVFHNKRLTEDERKVLNGPNGGWDCDPRFARYADITSFAKVDAVKEAIMLGEYELVATVESDSMDAAFQLTNHIDYDWRKNDNVDPVTYDIPTGPRSTSVGDLMVKADGTLHRVTCIGFKQIDGVSREALS